MKDIFAKGIFLIVAALMPVLYGCGPVPQEGQESREYTDWVVREQRVRQNMREVQIAAEHYASDHGHNRYPVSIDDSFKCYFPGGRPNEPSVVGAANPFTGANEFPALGSHINSVKEVRNGRPYKLNIGVGQIEYTPLGNGAGYAIVAAGHDGVTLDDPVEPGKVLILSNFDDD